MAESYVLDSRFLVGTVQHGDTMIVAEKFFSNEKEAQKEIAILQKQFPFMQLQPIRVHVIKPQSGNDVDEEPQQLNAMSFQ